MSWIRRISRRSKMYLVRVPEEYVGVFKALKGQRVSVKVGGYTFKGRVVVLSDGVYVSLPREAEPLWERRKPLEVVVTV